ncbi:MsnO8 family LLM class oxidoreductase [Devosia sp. 1635]|uniref:MsnO8 family LLM class oxidoreductase n=1 Tax=Devosia sp. 1635 TaxID=2726066 RepID=UPI0015677F94|nr:MsnO8 family LLM class oxidoreductase [Devosia sp. 1635]
MKLSLLDQVQIAPGSTAGEAIRQSIRLSQTLEQLGFERHWLVEHHAVPYEACVDPMVMALALAQATSSIRVGVGGVLLNNYSPYKIAESAKTLAALAPGRIDLGLGQSVSGPLPDLALQPDRTQKPAHDQAAKVKEVLGHLFADLPADHPFAPLKVMPDEAPPLPWIMAVGQTSAERAGTLGLPLALSAFHRPEEAQAAAAAYRKAFRPSPRPGLPPAPKLFLALRVTSAPSLAEAERLAMPMRWAFQQRRRFNIMPQRLPSVDEAVELAGGVWPAETGDWPMYTICALADLRARLLRMAEACGADEIMLQDVLPDPERRLSHYHDVAQVFS